jgi:ketosteroid isomerase-like protein
MKKTALAVISILFIAFPAFSQKGIKGLVNAEKEFAAFTATHTIRDGFLNYMDSAGLVFRQGAEVKAQEFYQKQKRGPGILSWGPAFAVVSASGDLGATTGPYEFRAKSALDTPVGKGSFSSVWKLNANGEWKNLADLGTSYNSVYPAITTVKEIVLPGGKETAVSYNDILALDAKFNSAIQEKDHTSLTSYLANDSWLNTDGQLPASGAATVINALENAPEAIQLSSRAGELSRAKDLAYVYGSVLNGTKKKITCVSGSGAINNGK